MLKIIWLRFFVAQCSFFSQQTLKQYSDGDTTNGYADAR